MSPTTAPTTIVIHQEPSSSAPATVRKTPPARSVHRLSRLKRASEEQLPPFRLTARDIQIIRAVYEHRALTTVQLQRLFFADLTAKTPINPRCQHRLKLLYHAGFLDRQEQPVVRAEGSRPLVYFLDGAGAVLLTQQGIEVEWDPDDNRVSWPFLQHRMATNDIRIAIATAATREGVTLTTWIDDHALKSPHQRDSVTVKGSGGRSRQVAVVPDGYFVLETAKRIYHHFLELDRGTVTARYTTDGKRDWAHKVRAFTSYLTSGKYEARYHTKTVRILTVTTGDRRMQHLKAVTEQVGGGTHFWFTTVSKATPQAILTEPIWMVAGSADRRPLLI